MGFHLTSLILSLLLCTGATSAQEKPSRPTTGATLNSSHREASKEAGRVNREIDALRIELRMRQLLGEVEQGRVQILVQRQDLTSANAELHAEKQNSRLAEGRVEHLLKATDELNRAGELKSRSIADLEKRNDQLKRDLGKNRKRAFWATAAAAVLGVVLVFK